MIGAFVHSRSARVTSIPSPSGRSEVDDRRRPADAAPRGRAPPAPWTRASPRTRRRAGRRAAPAGSAARRRRRARAGAARSPDGRRHRRRAGTRPRTSCPARAGTRPRSSRRSPRRSPARSPGPRPEPRWPDRFRARAVERLEDALALRRGDAGPAIDDAHDDALPDGPRAQRDGMPAGVAGGVLQQVREGALELRGVRAHERQVALDRDVERARPAAPGRRSTPRAPRRSSTTRGAARRRPPPGARDRAGSR